MRTYRYGYHPDLELSDRSRERLEMRTYEHGYHPDLELSDRSGRDLGLKHMDMVITRT